MFSTHPLERIPREPLIVLFIALLIGTGAFSSIYMEWGELLVHPGAPHGIISFEMVWSLAGLHSVIASWNETAREMAIQITIADYAYMVLYSTCIASACILLGRWLKASGRAVSEQRARNAAWLAWIAAGCDAIENAAGLFLLLNKPVDPWPLIMSIAATFKFGILAYVLLYLVFGTAALLLIPRRPS